MLNPIERIQRHVGLLAGHVRNWHAREHAGYVRAGQAALGEIDAAMRALGDARAQLADEIARDNLDRAVRVDAMLACFETKRAEAETRPGVTDFVPEQYVREQPDEDGTPLPGGVQGYGITGRPDGQAAPDQTSDLLRWPQPRTR